MPAPHCKCANIYYASPFKRTFLGIDSGGIRGNNPSDQACSSARGGDSGLPPARDPQGRMWNGRRKQTRRAAWPAARQKGQISVKIREPASQAWASLQECPRLSRARLVSCADVRAVRRDPAAGGVGQAGDEAGAAQRPLARHRLVDALGFLARQAVLQALAGWPGGRTAYCRRPSNRRGPTAIARAARWCCRYGCWPRTRARNRDPATRRCAPDRFPARPARAGPRRRARAARSGSGPRRRGRRAGAPRGCGPASASGAASLPRRRAWPAAGCDRWRAARHAPTPGGVGRTRPARWPADSGYRPARVATALPGWMKLACTNWGSGGVQAGQTCHSVSACASGRTGCLLSRI